MPEIFNYEKNQGKHREGITTELVKDVYLSLTEKKLGVALSVYTVKHGMRRHL